MPDLLYLEDANSSVSKDDPVEVRKYLDLFVELQEKAAPAEEFRRLLAGIALQRFAD